MKKPENNKTFEKLSQPNNPLHGVKLADILEYLVENFGWEKLASEININCFKNDPSIKSSLKFLRTTPWAREKVEKLYLKKIL
ncbi:MAG: VF530 family DNA-binding protein [Deltaproteobacteria bacterium]